MKTLLIVDDEKEIRESLKGVFRDEGYDVLLSESAEDALKRMDARVPDIVLLDIWLPGMDGTECLEKIKERHADLPVIMISGHANIENAVKSTKLGAYDFIEKPLSLDKVVLSVEHALEHKRLKDENAGLRRAELSRYEIIGSSKVMGELRAGIDRAAPSNGWVLITGENGTGKEYVARNIHLKSARAGKAFVGVNCAAIPEELIESELFGHEKGAFTSAIAQKKGRFDLADKGTIFLDEIGDMSMKTQAKILRILQEQSFERVGGVEQIRVDVRVIAATNKDLRAEITNGRFREDLYYRLNVIPFHVPPLRQRREDIDTFIEYFIGLFSRESGRPPFKMDEEASKTLRNYSWPGNVRELKNLVERLAIMVAEDTITIEDIPIYIKGSERSSTGAFSANLLRDARSEFEKEFIMLKLKEFGGNIAKTAEAIGIERSHLYRKIKTYGLEVRDE